MPGGRERVEVPDEFPRLGPNNPSIKRERDSRDGRRVAPGPVRLQKLWRRQFALAEHAVINPLAVVGEYFPVAEGGVNAAQESGDLGQFFLRDLQHLYRIVYRRRYCRDADKIGG